MSEHNFFSDSPTSPALEVRLMPNWADFFSYFSLVNFFLLLGPEHNKLKLMSTVLYRYNIIDACEMKNKWHPGYFHIFYFIVLFDFSFMLCDCLCTINFNNNSNNSWFNLLSRVLKCWVLSEAFDGHHRLQIIEHSQSLATLSTSNCVYTLIWYFTTTFFTSAMYNLRTRQRTAKN